MAAVMAGRFGGKLLDVEAFCSTWGYPCRTMLDAVEIEDISPLFTPNDALPQAVAALILDTSAGKLVLAGHMHAKLIPLQMRRREVFDDPYVAIPAAVVRRATSLWLQRMLRTGDVTWAVDAIKSEYARQQRIRTAWTHACLEDALRQEVTGTALSLRDSCVLSLLQMRR
jgi:hypothetical protein